MMNAHSFKFARHSITFFILGSALHLFASLAAGQTQEFELRSGWNLVSITAGDASLPVSGFKAAFADPSQIVEIWGFEPNQDPEKTIPGQWLFHKPGIGYPNDGDLTHLELGHGYWVKVAGGLAKGALTGDSWNGPLVLKKGWNLVGFPGLGKAGENPLDSIFSGSFKEIEQVWTFDAVRQSFEGYDLTSIPQVRELKDLAAGQGYFVYSTAEVDLSPGAFLALPADRDVVDSDRQFASEIDFDPELFPDVAEEDVARYLNQKVRQVGDEDLDYDLNNNGIIDYPRTQSVLKFDEGVYQQVITIGRIADTSGSFLWEIENEIPWLYTEPYELRYLDEQNEERERFKEASGSTASGVRQISLYVDRTGLEADTLEGTINVRLGDELRTIEVVMDISDQQGDYFGRASLTKVNGKEIGLGAVDFALSVSSAPDRSDPNAFRAIVDGDRTLLVPRDLSMAGSFYFGNEFVFTTRYQMDRGDRNAPPFDTFKHDDSSDGDKDWTDGRGTKGVMDDLNPFTVPIQREMSLFGERISPERWEGSYYESIVGLLPDREAIHLEGEFIIDREGRTPSKSGTYNKDSGQLGDTGRGLQLGGSDGDNFVETTFNFVEPIIIDGVSGSFSIDYDRLDRLKITLISPVGKEVVVHDHELVLANSFETDGFNTENGKGDWTVRIEWDEGVSTRGTFDSWDLDLGGFATYNLSGVVVDSVSGDPISGAFVYLAGAIISQQAYSDENGEFLFSGLTEDEYTVFASKFGYETAYAIKSINFQSASLDSDIELVPFQATEADIIASPSIVTSGSQVSFAVIPADLIASEVGDVQKVVWDFGDVEGTHDSKELTSAPLDPVPYVFDRLGVFKVTAKVVGSEGTRDLDLNYTVLPLKFGTGDALGVQPDGTVKQDSDNVFLRNIAFIGSIAARTDVSLNDSTAEPIGRSRNVVYQESQRDVAGFDINRHPETYTPSKEDTDFYFIEKGAIKGGDGQFETNSEETIVRLVTTMGGYVFSSTPARGDAKVGSETKSFQIQTGRIQP